MAGDRSKLPKWAQRELTRLERAVARLEEAAKEAEKAAGYARDNYGTLMVEPGTRVDFSLEPLASFQDERVQVYTETQQGVPGVTVRSRFGRLHVLPIAANTIRLEVTR